MVKKWVEKKAGQREAAPVAETVESMDRHWADHLVARSGMLMDGTKAAMWAAVSGDDWAASWAA